MTAIPSPSFTVVFDVRFDAERKLSSFLNALSFQTININGIDISKHQDKIRLMFTVGNPGTQAPVVSPSPTDPTANANFVNNLVCNIAEQACVNFQEYIGLRAPSIIGATGEIARYQRILSCAAPYDNLFREEDGTLVFVYKNPCCAEAALAKLNSALQIIQTNLGSPDPILMSQGYYCSNSSMY